MNPVLEAMYTIRPMIFAHRGAAAYAPPNTLPAFELAIAQGAHGVELDVHLSLDGHLVVIHDFSVDATTDGTGLVADLTLDNLKALDAGSRFAPAFAGTRIPTLDEVFETVGRHSYINVEIKSHSADTDGLEAAVAKCILRHQMHERVIVSSFNPLALKRFRHALPTVPIGFLYGLDSPGLPQDLICEAYHPHADLIDETFIAQAHAAGKLVNAWTVNDPARGRVLRDLAVDGIITDVPDQMLAAVQNT